MSISEKLTQLASIRSNIRTKLTEKGVEASDHNFSDFASDIENIPSGGGDPWEKLNDLLYNRLKYWKLDLTHMPPPLYSTNAYIGIGLVFFSANKNTGKILSGSIRTAAVDRALQYVNLGKPTEMGTDVLRGRLGVKSLIIGSSSVITVPSTTTIAPFTQGDCLLYVPDSLVSEYKSTTNWNTKPDQIKGFSEAPTYSNESEYSVGDVVVFNGRFYGMCHEDSIVNDRSIVGHAPSGTDADNEYWEYVATI